MRKDAIELEEKRLQGISAIEEYASLHERHRIFPIVFEKKGHKRILDIAAGVGVAGRNIQDNYAAEIYCNDISPTCLTSMQKAGLKTVSFDVDDEKPYPFPDKYFDAVIALATIEHLIHIDHFMAEIYRILNDEGCLYISAPNYSGLAYLLPFLLKGRTFHDPMSEASRYEFYAHVRYFTYKTLLEFVSSFKFRAEAVYLPIPQSSSRYKKLKSRSRFKAFLFQTGISILYRFFSPRWASEPVICFKKGLGNSNHNIRKVII